MIDLLKIKTDVHFVLKDRRGRVKRSFSSSNLIVDVGKDGIADQLLNSPSIPVPSHIGLGVGTAPPQTSDQTLEQEVGTRQAVTKERTLNEIEFFAVFGPNEPTNQTLEITEAGLFNAASGGDMWARITFGVVTKEPEDTFEVHWKWIVN